MTIEAIAFLLTGFACVALVAALTGPWNRPVPPVVDALLRPNRK